VSIQVYSCPEQPAETARTEPLRQPRSDRRRLLGGVAGASLLGIAGGATLIGGSLTGTTQALAAEATDAQPPTLPPAVAGERLEIDRRAGRLSYYVAGEGPPLLLLHSINATGSVFEVEPIFKDQVRDRRVFAPDLPGFGFSDRSDRRYDPDLYVQAIFDMLEVIAEDQGGTAPIDALALSLSSEFLARAATLEPQRFRRLVLVTPTGFDRRSANQRGRPGGTREMPWLYGLVERPPWRQGLFDLLVSRRSIRYFLERTFGSKKVDQTLIDYAWRSAHQPGARHAPYAFVSGALFSTDMRDVYEKLHMPVWVPHGTRGDFKDFSGAGWAEALPNWRFEAFPTGALPHFEMPDTFNAALRGFTAA
jgi:pimeloyl-ACP methyl ester carboxylesterase